MADGPATSGIEIGNTAKLFNSVRQLIHWQWLSFFLPFFKYHLIRND